MTAPSRSPTSPEEFAAHIKNELDKWRKVAKAAGIEPHDARSASVVPAQAGTQK